MACKEVQVLARQARAGRAGRARAFRTTEIAEKFSKIYSFTSVVSASVFVCSKEPNAKLEWIYICKSVVPGNTETCFEDRVVLKKEVFHSKGSAGHARVRATAVPNNVICLLIDLRHLLRPECQVAKKAPSPD
ncbi:hypothetical protein EVAR_52309_1 [Eumeta japonica]|uniref:Uncharacterized protein n=1 Tax=Eumeta variegata TaxID=151549 RepID=A0A4C1Y458_EUMVA|nr:hypothetical protein EVAR_52309_1 [Eumeta japonica]